MRADAFVFVGVCVCVMSAHQRLILDYGGASKNVCTYLLIHSF